MNRITAFAATLFLFFVSVPVLAATSFQAELEKCKQSPTVEAANVCFDRLYQQCSQAAPDCFSAVDLARVQSENIRLRAKVAASEASETSQWDAQPMVYTHGVNPGACLEIHGFDNTGPTWSTAFTFRVNGEWAHIEGGAQVQADLDRDGSPEDMLVDVMDGGSAYFVCDPYRRLEVELVQLDLNQAIRLASDGAEQVYVRNRARTRYFAHDPQAPPSRLSRKDGLGVH